MYILLALFLFGVLIFIHELGHYIAARICRVKVLEFAVGMGPKLIKWTSKKTGIKYSIRLLPVGGFCAMEGETENSNPRSSREDKEDDKENAVSESDDIAAIDENVQDRDPRSFKNKPAWMKIIILCAGPLMNIILGFVLTFIMVITTQVDGNIVLASNTVAKFNEELSISSETGLMENDKIVKVGNVPVHIWQELSYEIGMQGKEIEKYKHTSADGKVTEYDVIKLKLTVIRNGETIVLDDVKFIAVSENGIVIGNTDFYPYREAASVGNIIKHSWYWSASSVKMVWDSLIGLITGRFSISTVSGPVGATQVITEAAKSGAYTLLYIFIVISMNLGVFNLLPFLPLDGGHVVFALYELIFRRPAPKKVEEVCQMIGIILIFGLMIAVTVKDVIGIFIK